MSPRTPCVRESGRTAALDPSPQYFGGGPLQAFMFVPCPRGGDDQLDAAKTTIRK